MLSFFRRKRKDLVGTERDPKPKPSLDEASVSNTMKTYLLYAFGEIALVVIGILIALQVNNWNENRLERIAGKEFLKGIRNDLISDSRTIDHTVESQQTRLNILKLIDASFLLNNDLYNPSIDTTYDKPSVIFERGLSFRSSRGVYNAVLSDSQSQVLFDKELFQQIQNIYDEYERVYSIYDVLKVREDRVSWKWSYEMRNWTYRQIMQNQQLLSDLVYLGDQRNYYCQFLRETQNMMKNVVAEIEQELGM